MRPTLAMTAATIPHGAHRRSPQVRTSCQLKRLATRRLGLATALAFALGGPAFAQAKYPSQPIKLVVPYPAGGATDTLARTLAQKLQEAWGQPVLVENRPGAGGNIGLALVAKAAAAGFVERDLGLPVLHLYAGSGFIGDS